MRIQRGKTRNYKDCENVKTLKTQISKKNRNFVVSWDHYIRNRKYLHQKQYPQIGKILVLVILLFLFNSNYILKWKYQLFTPYIVIFQSFKHSREVSEWDFESKPSKTKMRKSYCVSVTFFVMVNKLAFGDFVCEDWKRVRRVGDMIKCSKTPGTAIIQSGTL